MKKKESVFAKIFAYTILLVLLISLAAVFLFSREFLVFYRREQRRLLAASFEPIISVIGKREQSLEEIIELAREFADNNRSFNFLIQSGNGKILFSTPNAEELPEDAPGMVRLRFTGMIRNRGEAEENAYTFIGYNSPGFIDYGDLVKRSLLALVLMLIIAVFGAVLFAKRVTKPLEDEIIRERAMEESQRLFFSAASHELKTPIAAARALVEGMIAGVGDYRDTRKYLRECLKTLDAQSNLVSEILEIVKLSDTETLNQSIIDIKEFVEALLDEYRRMAEQRNLVIQTEIKRASVIADKNLLQRVLSNVLANAVQNTPEGGTIRIETEEHKKLRLSVLNTGSSIPEELISRLFEPFFRLDTARTRHGTQSGLGLAIVKKSLDRMKCPFAVENKNEGVLFWVELPLSVFRKTSDNIQ